LACARLPGGGLALQREVEGAFDPGCRRFQLRIHGLEAPPRRLLVDGELADGIYDGQTLAASLSAGTGAGSWSAVEIR